jgi:hypothetical protein
MADQPPVNGRESPHVEVNVAGPLWKPYRTGSYLIYDVQAGKERESRHFRSAMSHKLPDHRYRASGSHQLNLTEFTGVLANVVQDHAPSTIYLVGLAGGDTRLLRPVPRCESTLGCSRVVVRRQ